MLKKCLFPVAGYGTRFLPATKAMPKEMMPIVNKPLIEYGVEEALEAGLKQMCFVTGRGKRALEDHFDINYELEYEIKNSHQEALLSTLRHLMSSCSFSYTRQRQVLGLGHAILQGQTLIGDEPFAVSLADDLCLDQKNGLLAQMSALYNQYQCSIIAVQQVSIEKVQQYGVIKGYQMDENLFKVEQLVEKPSQKEAPSNLAIIGRYILTPDIFSVLKNTPVGKNSEIQLTDALQVLAKNGKVIAYHFTGTRFDCGSVPGYIEATNYIYENYHKRKNGTVSK